MKLGSEKHNQTNLCLTGVRLEDPVGEPSTWSPACFSLFLTMLRVGPSPSLEKSSSSPPAQLDATQSLLVLHRTMMIMMMMVMTWSRLCNFCQGNIDMVNGDITLYDDDDAMKTNLHPLTLLPDLLCLVGGQETENWA